MCLRCRDRHPYRPPGCGEPGLVVLADGAVLVQHRQAHHVEMNLDVPDLFDLENPPRCHPGERAGWIEPEIRPVVGLGTAFAVDGIEGVRLCGGLKILHIWCRDRLGHVATAPSGGGEGRKLLVIRRSSGKGDNIAVGQAQWVVTLWPTNS